uniref:CID domain-containing protein n=2 Tax=Ditylum brightwellii TaxID=49249 RepID=A0A6S8UFV2_9STRA|mmetsp:Transcript_11160/g.16165  ORF Transcript_11160/g.16165 Transcript_11160/m.16165 type:complete len:635 (-) Transcript_11160:459-2363(-)
MWPRTPEERARNRNTGFVCFMTRADAQEAMDAFQDADPLDCGRRMVLRWGKNVKKTVKRGTGGVPIPPIRQKDKVSNGFSQKDQLAREPADENGEEEGHNKRRKTDHETSLNETESGSCSANTKAESSKNERLDIVMNGDSAAAGSLSTVDKHDAKGAPSTKPIVIKDSFPKFNPDFHSADAIRVVSPTDLRRLRFITTVASFIARDGSLLERKLIEKESSNPEFSFLAAGDEVLSFGSTGNNDEDEEMEVRRNEWIFYRWRVYSFAQGDGFDSWRTEPFVMFQPHGRYWIPPPLNQEAARREEEAAKQKEEDIRSMQEERRRLAEKKDFMTGRQLEHAKFGVTTKGSKDGSTKLTKWEIEKFNELLREKLCASRESICEAMAFCFDKSGAAKEISSLLKDALLEDGCGVSVETRIARLYLLSDVLFNSQQPGVRNAFRYRDAIEAMSPEVFDSLGKHGMGKGRMTMNKLRMAVSGVLSAWTNWSVYNATFLDELHARFEGKELKAPVTKPEEPSTENDIDVNADTEEEKIVVENQSQVTDAPRGDWTDAELIPASDDVDGEPLEDDGEANVDGDELCDVNNTPNKSKIDGEPIKDIDVDGDILSEEDVDGEELSDEDIDGEALDEDDVDGEPL